MCGITGFVGDKKIYINILYNMTNVIKHRGPDDEGYYSTNFKNGYKLYCGDDTVESLKYLSHIKNSNDKVTVGLGHRRLSILDITDKGHQPMIDDQNRFSIIHNGEVYNYKEIREELKTKKYSFISDTDTEVILYSYIEWGEKCVNKFIGMWSFAIWDNMKFTLFLSRDRFGIKPLYYTNHNNTLFFASEIKSLICIENFKKNININEAYDYFSLGNRTHQENTFFKNIKELLPGNNLVYDAKNNNFVLNEYYNLQNINFGLGLNLSEDQYIQRYKEYFNDSINLHMRSDVSLGTCLSGGLDSSAITYVLSQMSDTNISSFTASYPNTQEDETNFAKYVTNHLENVSGFYTYPTSDSYWDEIKKLIWHQDLPIHSTSMYSQWEVMKLASNNNIKVLLNGQGADESLGGYKIFAGLYLLNLLKNNNLVKFFQEKKMLKENRQINPYSELFRVLYHFLPSQFKGNIRSKVRIGEHFFNSHFIKKDNLRSNNTKNFYKTFKEALIWSIKYGLYELLRYEDRSSMAFSIESRVPFLDHRLVEFSLSLPDHIRFNNGWSKFPLRKIINKKLPDQIVWRKDKKGFVTPQSKWKNELETKIHHYIYDKKLPDFIDRNKTIKFIRNNELNETNISEYFKFISFLMWIDLYN